AIIHRQALNPSITPRHGAMPVAASRSPLADHARQKRVKNAPVWLLLAAMAFPNSAPTPEAASTAPYAPAPACMWCTSSRGMPNAGTALRRNPNPLTANTVRNSGLALSAIRAETFSPGASILVIVEGAADGATTLVSP